MLKKADAAGICETQAPDYTRSRDLDIDCICNVVPVVSIAPEPPHMSEQTISGLGSSAANGRQKGEGRVGTITTQ